MSAPTVWLVVTLTYPRGGGEPRETAVRVDGPLDGMRFEPPLTWRPCATPGKPAGSLEGVRGQRVAVRLEPIA